MLTNTKPNPNTLNQWNIPCEQFTALRYQTLIRRTKNFFTNIPIEINHQNTHTVWMDPIPLHYSLFTWKFTWINRSVLGLKPNLRPRQEYPMNWIDSRTMKRWLQCFTFVLFLFEFLHEKKGMIIIIIIIIMNITTWYQLLNQRNHFRNLMYHQLFPKRNEF